MTDEQTSPLMRLLAPRTLPRKKRKPNLPPPPSRVPQQHAAGLRGGAAKVKQHFEEAVRRLPLLATDVPYVRIELAPGMVVFDQELKSVGLIPVFRRDAAVLAAYSPDGTLKQLDQQLNSYAAQRRKLQVLSKIETVLPWSRDDRMSSRLRAVGLADDEEYTVDLLLLPIEGHPANPQAVPAIERFAAGRGGRLVDKSKQPSFTALRVRLGGQALSDLLDFRDDIALADLPPAAHVLVPGIFSIDIDQVPDPAPPEPTAPGICVVDSGVLEGHPLLEPAIIVEKSRSFPADLGPPIPASQVTDAKHGTQVSGIALYGDIAAKVASKTFEPEVWIANARLLDDNNELHPDRMPFIRDIVEHVGDRCRVFNLSFGLEPCEGFLSIHAAELDELTREHGALFVVSAGNENLLHLPPKAYPDFLLESGWRVLAPAESLNAITVGGITPDRDPYPHQTRKAIAPKRAPSPFTRAGGAKNVVKPELVEVAGNMAYDESTSQIVPNDPGLRVPTTSHEFAKGKLLGLVHGTSFAAPRVAHIAARLVNRYPDATPNLLRALLVQSARLPEGVAEWKRKDAMSLCGFGVPDLDRALYCRPQRVTLYYEGEIEVDEVKLFDVPVPLEVSKSKGRKTISVSVAYDPPVSVVHRDRPAGVFLTWGLARGDISESDVKAAIAAEAERDAGGADGNPRAKSVFMKGDLLKQPQMRGTVQKNVFCWKRKAYGETYRLAVIAKATRPAHAKDQQRYAVVVTLECEDLSVNIYSAVRSRLTAGRVRVRVKAE